MWNAHLENSHFRNSQWNPSLNPKLKFSFSRTILTLKFKILIISRDLLAYNWACHFCTGSLLAAAECVLRLSLQHELTSAADHGPCKPLSMSGGEGGHLGGEVRCQSPSPCVPAKPLCWAVPGRSHEEADQCKRNRASETWHSESTEFPCKFLKSEGRSHYWKQCFHGWSLR